MNIIQTLEAEQAAKLGANRKIPDFAPGDTVIVNVKVTEGERTRVQAYEGVCIARSGGGLQESFTVRKISYGEGVERVFPDLFAGDRVRSRSFAAARSVAPSSIICATAAASRRASPSASRAPPPRRPTRRGGPGGQADDVKDAPEAREPGLRSQIALTERPLSPCARRAGAKSYPPPAPRVNRVGMSDPGREGRRRTRSGASSSTPAPVAVDVSLQLSRARSMGPRARTIRRRAARRSRAPSASSGRRAKASGDNLKSVAEKRDLAPLLKPFARFRRLGRALDFAPRGMVLRMATRAPEAPRRRRRRLALSRCRQAARAR